MTEHEQDETGELDEAGLADDLEIKDAEEAETVKGGFEPVDGVIASKK